MNRSISLSPTKMTERNNKYLSLGVKSYSKRMMGMPSLDSCDTTPDKPPKIRDSTRKSSLLFNPSVLGGKLCLITDGCSEMGISIAKALIHHGASVVLAGWNMEQLKQSANQVRELYPDMPKACVRVVRAHITDVQSVAILFNTIDVFTDLKLGLVINNAEAIPELSPESEKGGHNEFRNVMNGSLMGPYLCSREAMKRMKESGQGGRIINIGGFSVHKPDPDPVTYNMSKFALLGLTQSLALEGRPYNVAASFIHPGNAETELFDDDEDATVETDLTGEFPDSSIDCEEGDATTATTTTTVELATSEVDMVPPSPTRKEIAFYKPDDVARRVVQMACLPFCINRLEMTVLANLLSDYDKSTMPIHMFALNAAD